MAYTGTIATEAEIALMAGENVDSTGDTEANRNLLMYHVEAYLCGLVQYDIVTNWATVGATSAGKIFTEYACRYCATALIAYNLLGDGGNSQTRIESEDQLNIHFARMKVIEEMLVNPAIKDFLGV